MQILVDHQVRQGKTKKLLILGELFFFPYSRSFTFSHKVYNQLVNFHSKTYYDLIRIVLSQYVTLGRIVTLIA